MLVSLEGCFGYGRVVVRVGHVEVLSRVLLPGSVQLRGRHITGLIIRVSHHPVDKHWPSLGACGEAGVTVRPVGDLWQGLVALGKGAWPVVGLHYTDTCRSVGVVTWYISAVGVVRVEGDRLNVVRMREPRSLFIPYRPPCDVTAVRLLTPVFRAGLSCHKCRTVSSVL